MNLVITVVGGFAGGVFTRSLLFSSWWPVILTVVVAALLGAVAFYKKLTLFTLGAVFLACAALGMLRTAMTEMPLLEPFVRDVGQRVSYEGVVVADPDVRDKNQRVEIEVTQGKNSTTVLAFLPRYAGVAVGDRVWVSGTLDVPEAFADDGGRIFRYDKYLQRDGVRFILSFAYIRVDAHAPWYSPPAALARIKHWFLDGLAATLPEPHASLAGGVVIGGKSGLGNELKDDFVKSGLVQIIVLSGYNVMVVAEWIMAALALTTLSRRSIALAGAIALLVFVGIAGFSATAIRAALMALIALYARATGRTYAAGRALLVAIFLMLVWNPLYLAFDPGFGLSVAATAGLIWLAAPIEHVLLRLRKVRQVQRYPVAPSGATGLSETLSKNAAGRASFWVTATATTLAAQIAVLPLLLYETGNLSLVAIPANLLTMPIVPLAMGLSALAGFAGIFFGTIAPLIGIVLAFPAYLANAYLIFVAHGSASLPFAAFTLPPFPFWLVLVAYALLIYVVASKRFSTMLQLRFAKKASM